MKNNHLQRRATLLILLFGTLSLFLLASRFHSGITIIENSAQLDFPRRLTFKFAASSESEITELYLLRKSSARSCSGGYARQQVKNFSPGKQVQVEWTWDFLDSGGLPPGAEISWQWEARTSAGEMLTSESKALVLEDDRFEWKRLEQDPVTVVWAEGSQAFGRQLLQTSLDSLKRVTRQSGVEETGNIRITVYPSFDDLREALLFEPEWVGGQTFVDYDIIMTAITPDQPEWAEEVIPHELAHVVTSQATFNCVGASLSTWLSEGLAQLGEGDLPEEVEGRILDDLQNGELPALKSLQRGFPDNPDRANQAYEFSYVVVDFLVRTFGSEAMGQVLKAIQSGELTDQALEMTYGLDTAGIDQTWRAANGVGEAPIPALPGDESAAPTRTAIATLALWTPAFNTSTQDIATEVVEVAALPSATKVNPTAAPTTQIAPPLAATSAPEQDREGASPLRCLGGTAGFPVLFALWVIIFRKVGVNNTIL
jgi:hypothetical protein